MKGSPAQILMAVVVLGLSYLAWAGYVAQPSQLERIQHAGELVVVTRIGAGTYYQGQTSPAGLEYDLAKRFAEDLGVELRLIVARDRAEIFKAITNRQAHIVAAGITATEKRREQFRFTHPYMNVHQQLVYRVGQSPPRDLSQIEPGQLMVVAGSSHAETLARLQEEYPGLEWTETQEYGTEELLYRIWANQLDYTIVDSNELVLNQRFYPELRGAFDVATSLDLAWALPREGDGSLYEAAQTFFQRIERDGTLAHLLEKYYGHLNRFDYVGTRTFMRHITERLPQYRAWFEDAAAQYGLDWRLVAAIGYQESHWDPRAVSPTGVRGIMMLTLNTSSDVGVTNRLDPKQSIYGGARYFARVHAMVPDRIGEPVRTWLALAAYNVGYGHLLDARSITAQQGGDPDSWVDVKERLPLLSQRQWYTQTRHGYARGWEPVRYVENVRTYYELLVRITEPELMHLNLTEPGELPLHHSPRGLRLGDQLESAF